MKDKYKKNTDSELADIHIDLTMELAHLARAIHEIHDKISELSNIIEEVELELEVREHKSSGKLSN